MFNIILNILFKVNRNIYMRSTSSKKPKQKYEKGLFYDMSFILLVDNLAKKDVENISIQVLQNNGSLETLECGSDLNQGRKIKANYLLCDPTLDPKELRDILNKDIVYKQALDLSFVESCVSAGRILPIGNFALKQRQHDPSSEPKKRTKLDKTQEKQQPDKKLEPVKQEKKQLKDITKPSNNKFIIDQLAKLLKVYSNEGDKGRKIAYSRAIGSIKSLDHELETDQDVDKLKTTAKHIGDKIVDKIKQLLKTGHIRKLEQLKNTDENIALEQITRVWGIGAAKAKQMYLRGVRNLDDLRQQVQAHPDILTKNQKIGLKYVEDLQIRIPRKKVTLMFQIVRDTLYQLVGTKHLHDIEVCGSYRRGKQTCGDMDIFITRKDGQYEKTLLTKLVQKLQHKGFLTDHLGMPRHTQNRNCQSYMGICHYKDELHHRIDIKYYPVEEFAFAVLYFTGSDMFNRKMRLQAIQKGYTLSDHGMYRLNKVGKNEEKGEQIKCKTEKQIFQVLGIQYKEPKDRDI